jgi:hypothetical protein
MHQTGVVGDKGGALGEQSSHAPKMEPSDNSARGSMGHQPPHRWPMVGGTTLEEDHAVRDVFYSPICHLGEAGLWPALQLR